MQQIQSDLSERTNACPAAGQQTISTPHELRLSMDNDDRPGNMFDEECNPFLEKGQQTVRPTLKGRSSMSWYCGIFALALSLFLNTILLSQQWAGPAALDSICADHTAQSRSPISDAIDISYQTVTFNGSFVHESLYNQPPSDAVELAWDDLGTDLRLSNLPEDTAELYGLDPGHLKVKTEQGGGYPVLFEFHHHFHCLNLLRKTSWFNFNHYNATQIGGFQDGEAMVRKHVGHCINQLRQVIMCNPDMAMIGQIWVEDIDGPYVNFFAQKHKCKNWDAIQRKAKELQVPEGTKLMVRLQEGDLRIPTIP